MESDAETHNTNGSLHPRHRHGLWLAQVIQRQRPRSHQLYPNLHQRSLMKLAMLSLGPWAARCCQPPLNNRTVCPNSKFTARVPSKAPYAEDLSEPAALPEASDARCNLRCHLTCGHIHFLQRYHLRPRCSLVA